MNRKIVLFVSLRGQRGVPPGSSRLEREMGARVPVPFNPADCHFGDSFRTLPLVSGDKGCAFSGFSTGRLLGNRVRWSLKRENGLGLRSVRFHVDRRVPGFWGELALWLSFGAWFPFLFSCKPEKATYGHWKPPSSSEKIQPQWRSPPWESPGFPLGTGSLDPIWVWVQFNRGPQVVGPCFHLPIGFHFGVTLFLTTWTRFQKSPGCSGYHLLGLPYL